MKSGTTKSGPKRPLCLPICRNGKCTPKENFDSDAASDLTTSYVENGGESGSQTSEHERFYRPTTQFHEHLNREEKLFILK